MITKADWNDALAEWAEEETDRLGGPPSPEEVVAYLRGELSGAAAERVHALLVFDPALTHLLDERVVKLRPRSSMAMRVYAIAATVIIAVLLVPRDQDVPTVASSQHELNPFRARGPAPLHELPAGEKQYLLTIVLSQPADANHELEITRDNTVVWNARDVQPIDGAFAVVIPGDFLDTGRYTLTVRRDNRVIDRYSFEVTPPVR